MSTIIVPNLNDIAPGQNSSFLRVNSRQANIEDLADYVQRVRSEKGLSQRAVEEKSGGKISKAYIGQIENRDVLGPSVTTKKLRALAHGLGVPEGEVRAVAWGIAPPVTTVEVSAGDLEDRAKRRELMALLFDDIPDDCQLDTLASMVGVHARRGVSLRVHERSGARSEALLQITRLVNELLPSAAAPQPAQAVEPRRAPTVEESRIIIHGSPEQAGNSPESIPKKERERKAS